MSAVYSSPQLECLYSVHAPSPAELVGGMVIRISSPGQRCAALRLFWKDGCRRPALPVRINRADETAGFVIVVTVNVKNTFFFPLPCRCEFWLCLRGSVWGSSCSVRGCCVKINLTRPNTKSGLLALYFPNLTISSVGRFNPLSACEHSLQLCEDLIWNIVK